MKSKSETKIDRAILGPIMSKMIPEDYEESILEIGKKIVIGPFIIKVELMSPRESDAENSYGHFTEMDLMIRLRPNQIPQQLGNTMLHELLHACHHTWDVTDKADEETFARCTAHALQAVWRDNPQLMLWFTRIFQDV